MASITFELSEFESVSTFSVDGTEVGGGLVAVAGSTVGVGGKAVGMTVGGGFVGVKTVTVGINGIAVGDEVGVDAGVQAATKITVRISKIIILWGLVIFIFFR